MPMHWLFFFVFASTENNNNNKKSPSERALYNDFVQQMLHEYIYVYNVNICLYFNKSLFFQAHLFCWHFILEQTIEPWRLNVEPRITNKKMLVFANAKLFMFGRYISSQKMNRKLNSNKMNRSIVSKLLRRSRRMTDLPYSGHRKWSPERLITKFSK